MNFGFIVDAMLPAFLRSYDGYTVIVLKLKIKLKEIIFIEEL